MRSPDSSRGHESGGLATAAAADVERARLRSARAWIVANAHQIAVVALPPVAVSSFLLGVTSEHLAHPRGASAYWTYLVVAPVLVGLVWWRRRPTSRLGPLLVALGYMSWPISWQGSDVPLIYSLGVLGIAPLIAMSLYICLAFSTGRLQHASDRRLLATLVFVLSLFFGASLLLSPTLVGDGPLAACTLRLPEQSVPGRLRAAAAGRGGEVRHLRRAGRRRRCRRRLGSALPGRDTAAAANARPGRSNLAAARAVAVRLLLLRARGGGRSGHVRRTLLAARRDVDRVPARLRDRAPAGRSLRRPGVPTAPERAREPADSGGLARDRRRCARRPVAAARLLGSRRRTLPRRRGRRPRRGRPTLSGRQWTEVRRDGLSSSRPRHR